MQGGGDSGWSVGGESIGQSQRTGHSQRARPSERRGRRDETESTGIGGGLMGPPPPPVVARARREAEEEAEEEESEQ